MKMNVDSRSETRILRNDQQRATPLAVKITLFLRKSIQVVDTVSLTATTGQWVQVTGLVGSTWTSWDKELYLLSGCDTNHSSQVILFTSNQN